MPTEIPVVPRSIGRSLCRVAVSICSDDLVYSFNLPVDPGMLDRAGYWLDTEVIIERLESSIDELSVVISYYSVRHFEPTHNTSPYEVLHVFHRDGCERFDLDPFDEVVHFD